jgi:GNAT superfamily N-acetyltransferase
MSEALQVITRTTEELTASDRQDVIRLCIDAHDNEAFVHLFEHIPYGGRHVLAYLGSELVSHAVATTRWLQAGDAPLMRTAYIDAVSTAPPHEGNGYGSACMRRLADSFGDYEIGCLQTDNAAGFYERLGWELWHGPLGGRRPDGTVIPTPHQRGIMILRLPNTPSIDPGSLLTVEETPARIWE